MTEFKKMAGTAAVFVFAHQHANTPAENQGMVWSDRELQLETLLPHHLQRKATLHTSLALEGLETYDPPCHGDIRRVEALNADFAYICTIKGWVEMKKVTA